MNILNLELLIPLGIPWSHKTLVALVSARRELAISAPSKRSKNITNPASAAVVATIGRDMQPFNKNHFGRYELLSLICLPKFCELSHKKLAISAAVLQSHYWRSRNQPTVCRAK